MKIYKFVKWEVPDFQDIEESKVHQVYKKAEQGNTTSRQQERSKRNFWNIKREKNQDRQKLQPTSIYKCPGGYS